MAPISWGWCSSCRRGRPVNEHAGARHRVLCTCGCGAKPRETMISPPCAPHWQCRCVQPAELIRSEQTATPANSAAVHLRSENQITWLLGLVAWFLLRVREVPGSIPGAAHSLELAWRSYCLHSCRHKCAALADPFEHTFSANDTCPALDARPAGRRQA